MEVVRFVEGNAVGTHEGGILHKQFGLRWLTSWRQALHQEKEILGRVIEQLSI